MCAYKQSFPLLYELRYHLEDGHWSMTRCHCDWCMLSLDFPDPMILLLLVQGSAKPDGHGLRMLQRASEEAQVVLKKNICVSLVVAVYSTLCTFIMMIMMLLGHKKSQILF